MSILSEDVLEFCGGMSVVEEEDCVLVKYEVDGFLKSKPPLKNNSISVLVLSPLEKVPFFYFFVII